MAALADPGRVESLVLFESVLFSLLTAEDPTRAAALEIGARFVDYWMGPGTWACMPEARREAIATQMQQVKAEWHAVFMESTPLSAFAALDMPVLYLTGAESPASSREVARLLTKTLPRVTAVEVEGVGHMAPLTHPERVNALIEGFLNTGANARSIANPTPGRWY